MNSNRSTRRSLLLEDMAAGQHNGIDCRNCSAVCCTETANTMQITPVEAEDLLEWLQTSGRLNVTLYTDLKNCIETFRLDHEPPGNGQRNFMRPRYTCPFLKPGPLGCTVSRHAKPYGCLAFNPQEPGQTAGGNCRSDQSILHEREKAFPAEQIQNQNLCEQYGIPWPKAPLPLMLSLIIYLHDPEAATHLHPCIPRLPFKQPRQGA